MEEVVRPGDRVEVGPVTFVVEYDLTPEAMEYLRGQDQDVDVLAALADGAVVDLEGQRVSATDRLYLAERLPTLLIWGNDDPIIPIEHARAAQARIPESRLVELAGAGHWPQLDDPDRFVAELAEFVETTEPHVFDLDRMREMLRRGPELDAAPT